MSDDRTALARLASGLLVPERSEAREELLATNRWPELLDYLQDNKVPLLSLAHDARAADLIEAVDALRVAVEAHRARWQQQRDEFEHVHNALDAAGIRHVLIKSAGVAPSYPYMSDNTDTLVPLQLGQRTREVLCGLGYIELLNIEEPHKFLFRKFHDGQSIGAFHLHEFVGWGTGFMSDEGVLARAIPAPDDPTLLIPSREDALLITYAHAFYEDKVVKLGDLLKAIWLMRGPDLDWDAMQRQAEARGWRHGLATCIRLWASAEQAWLGDHSYPEEVLRQATEDTPAYSVSFLEQSQAAMDKPPIKVGFRFSKRHYYSKVLCDADLSAWQKTVDIVKHSWAGVERRLPFRPQRGMLVTFSGVDGSGKTTLAKKLLGVLDLSEISARYVWTRGASSPFADAVIKLVKPLLPKGDIADTTSDTRAAKVSRKASWLKRPLLRWGWCLLVAIDLLSRYWLRVWLPLSLGRVVVADRYIYDAIVELVALADETHLGESLYVRMLLALVPRPHLAYCLDLEPEVALERDPEETLSFLEREAFVYEIDALPWGMCLLDASQPPDVLADTVIDAALIRYYAKPRRDAGRHMDTSPSGS